MSMHLSLSSFQSESTEDYPSCFQPFDHLDQEFIQSYHNIEDVLLKHETDFIDTCLSWFQWLRNFTDKKLRNKCMHDLEQQVITGELKDPYRSKPNQVVPTSSWSDLSESEGQKSSNNGQAEIQPELLTGSYTDSNEIQSDMVENSKKVSVYSNRPNSEGGGDICLPPELNLDSKQIYVIEKLDSKVSKLTTRLGKLRNAIVRINLKIKDFEIQVPDSDLLERFQKCFTEQENKHNFELLELQRRLQIEVQKVETAYQEEHTSLKFENQEKINELTRLYEGHIQKQSLELERIKMVLEHELTRVQKQVSDLQHLAQELQSKNGESGAPLRENFRELLHQNEKIYKMKIKAYATQFKAILHQYQLRENALKTQLASQKSEIALSLTEVKRVELKNALDDLEERYRSLIFYK